MPQTYLANVAYLQGRVADAVAYQRRAVELGAAQRAVPPQPRSPRSGAHTDAGKLMRSAVSRRRWGVSGWLVSGALAAAVCVGACRSSRRRAGGSWCSGWTASIRTPSTCWSPTASCRTSPRCGATCLRPPCAAANRCSAPILWTTIATGKPPDQHQIGHFVAVNPTTGEQLPVTSRMRKVKALWNIAHGSGAVGWRWWDGGRRGPPRPVTGAVVSDHTCYHFLLDEGVHGGGERSASVYPPMLADRDRGVGQAARRSVARRSRTLRPGRRGGVRPGRSISTTPRPLQMGVGHRRELPRHRRGSVADRPARSADGVHRRRPTRPRTCSAICSAPRVWPAELADQQRQFGGAVEAMYGFADRLIGELVAMMDADTTLVVLSDHGFALGALPDDPSVTRDMRRVSERYHRDDGILYLYRRGVRPGSTIAGATLLDVALTVLALMGVAVPQDMSGRVLTDGLRVADPRASWRSYRDGRQRCARPPATMPSSTQPCSSTCGASATSTPSRPRAIATSPRVLFQQGKSRRGGGRATPRWCARARTTARCAPAGRVRLGALGRYDEALREIDRAIAAAPLNPEGFHNRAVIREHQGSARRGDRRLPDRACATVPPTRRRGDALRRLGRRYGRRDARPTPTARPACWRSTRPIWRAAATTPRAMRALDEAERAARASALVFHYRANVAFLMGAIAPARSPRCSRRSRSSRTTRCSGRIWRACAEARRRSGISSEAVNGPAGPPRPRSRRA